MTNKSLKKGLDIIFGGNLTETIEEIQNSNSRTEVKKIAVNKIMPNPYQPRKVFDPVKLGELKQSILQNGVFTPIIVRNSVNGFQLIAGERRLRASTDANLKTIPAIVVDFDDDKMSEIALLENLQRENLNVIEEAIAYKTLMTNQNLTQEELAIKISKPRPSIANKIRLLSLPQQITEAVMKNQLSMGQVKPLLALRNPEIINELGNKIITEKLTSRKVEEIVRGYLRNKNLKITQKLKPDYNYQYIENLFRNKLLSKVSVNKNKIIINFNNDDHLNDILQKLELIK